VLVRDFAPYLVAMITSLEVLKKVMFRKLAWCCKNFVFLIT